MSLATRVSLFFLGSLAVTLAGFSVALYLLAARYLEERLDRRVEAAIALLTAAIEIKPDCVEWEPHERRLDLEGVRWVVLDHEGRTIDASAEPLPHALDAAGSDGGRPSRVPGKDRETWLTLRSKVVPTDPARPLPPTTGPRKDGNRGGIYPSLLLVASTPTGPDDASLRVLGWTLAVLSAAAWAAAALVGRRLCRRTLAPVARMARSARSIPAAEPGQRLKVSPTGDELEDLGRSFNGLLDRLQEAFERQRRFTGEASHQLRTPLAVMLGQVEVALRRDRPPEEYRRVLGVVAEQSARLHGIVEMLLFMARADSDAAAPELSPLDLRAWLEGHLAGWSSHPRAADLKLASGGEGLRALAHPPLLAQATDALIDNACKYSTPGTPVTLTLRGEDGHVHLTVQDAGCGIAAEDLPRVFEPFFQSMRHRPAGAGGVGLGLAIARRVVVAMGGDVEAQSEPGRGSRFSIRLRRGKD